MRVGGDRNVRSPGVISILSCQGVPANEITPGEVPDVRVDVGEISLCHIPARRLIATVPRTLSVRPWARGPISIITIEMICRIGKASDTV